MGNSALSSISHDDLMVKKVIMSALELYEQTGEDEDSNDGPDPLEFLITLATSSERETVRVIMLLLKTLPSEDHNTPTFLSNLLECMAMPSLSNVDSYGQKLAKECLRLLKPSFPQRLFAPFMDEFEVYLRERFVSNANFVWASIGERMAGILSEKLFTAEVEEVLAVNMDSSTWSHLRIPVPTLIAIEKLSSTSINKKRILENKRIMDGLKRLSLIDVPQLPKTLPDRHSELIRNFSLDTQLKFYSKWLLAFPLSSNGASTREECMKAHSDNLRCCMDRFSSTVGWKCMEDGLELRSDSLAFHSYKASRGARSGRWYYEVTLVTRGVMQIGWATKSCKFDTDGEGVGDDANSIGFDGCRRCLWFNGPHVYMSDITWCAGNVLGFEVNFDEEPFFKFYINGDLIEMSYTIDAETFKNMTADSDLYPAGSTSCYQHIILNFGAKEFKYPPERPFNTFNEDNLTAKEIDDLKNAKKLLINPNANLIDESLNDLAKCTICYSHRANMRLQPCHHEGFCVSCALQFEQCPICRSTIEDREEVDEKKEVPDDDPVNGE